MLRHLSVIIRVGEKLDYFKKFVTDAHNNIERRSIYQNIQYILLSEMVT